MPAASILSLAARVSTGLVAGAFLLGSRGLSPVVNGLAEPIQIRVRQAVIPRFRAFLLPMMLMSMMTTGLSAWRGSPSSGRFAWSAFGLACAMLALTIAINVPVNNRILQWS